MNSSQPLNFNVDDIDVKNCNSYVLSAKGIVIGCSDASAATAGMDSPNDLIGSCSYELLSKEDAVRIQKNDQQVLALGKTMVLVERYINFEGIKKIATSIKTPVRLKGKKISVITGISITQDDIPEAASSKKILENNFNLTPRQLDCLYYLARGYSWKEMSEAMCLSQRTIEHYLEMIKIKLNTTRRSKLISMAFEIPAIVNRLIINTTGQ